MGRKNDWSVMRCAAKMLREFGVTREARVLSAHRLLTETACLGTPASPGARCPAGRVLTSSAQGFAGAVEAWELPVNRAAARCAASRIRAA